MSKKNSTKNWEEIYKSVFGETFKNFHGYWFGDKGTVFNRKMKPLLGKGVIKIDGKSYRRDVVMRDLHNLNTKKTKKMLWVDYKRKAKELTNNQPLHQMKDFDKRSFDDYHVDHIIPIKMCWKNGLSVTECASIMNLQMLSASENKEKNSNKAYSVISQCEHLKKLI